MQTPPENTLKRAIIVIGGSAGALRALEFIADLPADFPGAIFLVVHIAAHGPGLLPRIIANYSSLPVEHVRDGEAILAGRIYVAPPDCHLSIREGFVAVAAAPKANRHRPSIVEGKRFAHII